MPFTMMSEKGKDEPSSTRSRGVREIAAEIRADVEDGRAGSR